MPPADLQRPFPLSGRVTAAKPPKEKRGGFGANKFARNPVALFLPAQSVIIRFQFRFELRARADSPLYRGSLPLRGEATCGRSGGGAVRGDAEADALKVPLRTCQQTASQSSFAADGHRTAALSVNCRG